MFVFNPAIYSAFQTGGLLPGSDINGMDEDYDSETFDEEQLTRMQRLRKHLDGENAFDR